MKKIAVLAAVVMLFVASVSWAGCNFSTFTKWDVSGQREGQKTYDLYYKNDPRMNHRVGDQITITLVMDYTDWGRVCRLKDTPNFPPNAKTSIDSYIVNLSTGQLRYVGVRYMDFNCQMISDFDYSNSDWFSPSPNSMGEEFVKIGRILAGMPV